MDYFNDNSCCIWIIVGGFTRLTDSGLSITNGNYLKE